MSLRLVVVLFLFGCGSESAAPGPAGPAPSVTPAPSGGVFPPPVGRIGCDDPLFVDDPALVWREVTVAPAAGMDGIRAAIADSDRAVPTRVKVAAGRYTGTCLLVEDHLRSAAAPLALVADGEVQIDCTDGNGQAFGFIHASYFSIEGFTLGPASGYYGDSGVHVGGRPVSPEDPAHYGQWQTSDHFVVRNNVMRNLNRGPDGDGDPDHYESGCCDGAKANQTEFIWYVGNTISRTARHGIDNVGVHHAAICNNRFFDLVGEGQGVEAKGGSYDIVIEGNTFERVFHRALMLGGEGTNNNFMWPVDFPAEAYGVVARNNLIVNAAEGGVTFYGCWSCAAINNSVWFTADYVGVPAHDFMRMYPSILEGGTYDEWGAARRAQEVLGNKDNMVMNNFFGSAVGSVTCPLDAPSDGSGTRGLHMSHNVFYNGGAALPECGEGASSLAGYPDAGPLWQGALPVRAAGGFPGPRPDLTPTAGGPLVAAGALDARVPARDHAGAERPRPPSIGALEPR